MINRSLYLHACNEERVWTLKMQKEMSSVMRWKYPPVNMQGPFNMKKQTTEDPNFTLKLLNYIAASVHLIFFVTLTAVWLTKGRNIASFRLTEGAMLVHWGSNETENIPLVGGCLAEGSYATPNSLSFKKTNQQCSSTTNSTSSDNGVIKLVVDTYFKDTGLWMSIPALTISFFLLSSIFQFSVAVGANPFTKWNHRYNEMFPPNEEPAEDKQSLLQTRDDAESNAIFTINYHRYFEYSISASVMIMAIGVVAGIYDLHILVCLFTLSWACMLTGCGAEVFLRIHQVLERSPIQRPQKNKETEKGTERKQNKETEKGEPYKVYKRMSTVCMRMAVLFHLIGWICIIVAWIVILRHYTQLWGLDKTTQECMAFMGPSLMLPSSSSSGVSVPCGADSGQPPQFVQIIMWMQFSLFLLFGLVQTFQLIACRLKWDSQRKTAEMMYVILSLTAKAILGGFISFYLFV